MFFLAFWWNLQKLAIKMQFFAVIDVFAEFRLVFFIGIKKINLIISKRIIFEDLNRLAIFIRSKNCSLRSIQATMQKAMLIKDMGSKPQKFLVSYSHFFLFFYLHYFFLKVQITQHLISHLPNKAKINYNFFSRVIMFFNLSLINSYS